MPPQEPPVHLLTRQVMDVAHVFDLAGGRVVAYSRGKPGQEADNEDAICVIDLDDERAILAVADGAGGHAGGAVAARVALTALAEQVRSAPEGQAMRVSLLDGIEAANDGVKALGTGAAATLAVVEIDGGTVRPYHVGDAEILVVGQRGRVRLQIVPHSPTGYAVEAGLLGEDEAIGHEDRHLVSNVVGAPDMRIEMGSGIRLGVRDTVLLASDGLFDNLRGEEIVGLVRKGPLAGAAASLVSLVGRRMAGVEEDAPSKPDDLSFVLYRRCVPRPPAREGGGRT
jgi:serine/threonine protein phosphatase PrpC